MPTGPPGTGPRSTRAGDRLITGSAVQVTIGAGDDVVADLGTLGRVELSVARSGVAPSREGIGHRVVFDHREVRSGIPDALAAAGIELRPEQLPAGDYVISDRLVVERKTGADLAASIKDRRLFEQIERLKETFEAVVLVVEGEPVHISEAAGRARWRVLWRRARRCCGRWIPRRPRCGLSGSIASRAGRRRRSAGGRCRGGRRATSPMSPRTCCVVCQVSRAWRATAPRALRLAARSVLRRRARAARGARHRPGPWRGAGAPLQRVRPRLSGLRLRRGASGVVRRKPTEEVHHGRPRSRRQRRVRRDLQVHELRLRAQVGSTDNLPPCPSCQNGEYNAVTGGDSRDDPYPDR